MPSEVQVLINFKSYLDMEPVVFTHKPLYKKMGRNRIHTIEFNKYKLEKYAPDIQL